MAAPEGPLGDEVGACLAPSWGGAASQVDGDPRRFLPFWVSAAEAQRCGVKSLKGSEACFSNSCFPSPSNFGVDPRSGGGA